MEAIGPLQLRVMHHLWANGASTVHQVHAALNDQPGAPKLAYTTILTVMRNLSRRKIVSQKPCGRSHIFEALIDEQTYKLDLVKHLRNDYFGGDVKRLLKMVSADEEIAGEMRKTLAGLAK